MKIGQTMESEVAVGQLKNQIRLLPRKTCTQRLVRIQRNYESATPVLLNCCEEFIYIFIFLNYLGHFFKWKPIDRPDFYSLFLFSIAYWNVRRSIAKVFFFFVEVKFDFGSPRLFGRFFWFSVNCGVTFFKIYLFIFFYFFFFGQLINKLGVDQKWVWNFVGSAAGLVYSPPPPPFFSFGLSWVQIGHVMLDLTNLN